MQGGDGTTEYEEKTLVQSMKLLTEMNLRWDSSRQNIRREHRTLQIVGHLVSVDSIYSVLYSVNSFSMMYIVLCISLLDP